MGTKRNRGEKASPGEKRRLALLREVLEYALPPDRAEEALAGMLDALGSFGGVVAAPEAELARAPGMDPRAAHFLRVALDLAKACMEDEAERLKRVMDTRSAVELVRPKFVGRKTEAVGLMLLDSRKGLLYNGILNEGSIGAVPVYIRRLVGLCIQHDAQSVLLAHNHPSGQALPSREDIVVTRQVQAALMSIDAALQDHIIFAGEDVMSFRDCGLLASSAARLMEERREELDAAREQAEELAWRERQPKARGGKAGKA